MICGPLGCQTVFEIQVVQSNLHQLDYHNAISTGHILDHPQVHDALYLVSVASLTKLTVTILQNSFHEERGLVTIEHFLGCAESAVLFLYKLIRLQVFMLVP